MKNYKNKTVFITGGASGIGLALGRAYGKRGANVMLADIKAANLARAKQDLADDGINAETVVCDVVDAASVQTAADATLKAFGKVHMVFNNAGVSLAGKSGQIKLEDWRWIVDINLMGVVHGIEIFTPIFLDQGEGGYFVNTASMAGHLTMANLAPYNATKFAVVGYSESLAQELKPLGIGVSVLCPTWIQSNIHNAPKGRPSFDPENDDIKDDPMYQMAKHVVENGLPADTFAELVVASVAADRFYIFTDPKVQPAIDTRRDLIMTDYEACLADLKELE